ncbi:uncharacterized protein LOC119731728 [Patiria miniata]|uniref:NTR domain-containing protein n=1 Tax=Patiria miniata TaxID=46514 RepID=A0A914AAJ3_PATMI|nr:uncharacterized protein LOC119731728 [Patiria miniata]
MCNIAAGIKILAVAATIASFQTVESTASCNCTRIHPQQHFCTANYVIRGRVVLIQWQLIPDLDTESTTVTETLTNPTSYMTSNPLTQGPEATGKEVDKSTALPSSQDQDQNEFIDAMPAHRHNNQRANRKDKRLLKNRIINQEPWNYEIIYIITIQTVYKNVGGDSLIEGEELELKSPYPGMGFCGVELRAGKSYLLAGGEAGQINMCDWIQEYRHISKLQKRGLKNNYGQLCDMCQIMTCGNPECTSDLPSTTCVYLPPHDDHIQHGIGYHDNDCIARHSRCYAKGRKADKCDWMKSSDMKNCQRKGRRNKN